MIVSTVEKLFKLIEEKERVVVLFLTPHTPIPANLQMLYDHDKVLVFDILQENIEILQVVKVPQVRVYQRGNEIKTLVGDDILYWRKFLGD